MMSHGDRADASGSRSPAAPTGVVERLSHLVRVRRPAVTERQLRRVLANACGISLQAVRLWFESGTPNIKAQHLMSLALAFDTTVDWLLMGEGEPPFREPQAVLAKVVEPGGYQYQDGQGRIHQLEDLCHADLLQVVCELINLVEDLDADAGRMRERIEAWRIGKYSDPEATNSSRDSTVEASGERNGA